MPHYDSYEYAHFFFCRYGSTVSQPLPELQHEPTSRLTTKTFTTQPPLKEIIEAQKGKEKDKRLIKKRVAPTASPTYPNVRGTEYSTLPRLMNMYVDGQ